MRWDGGKVGELLRGDSYLNYSLFILCSYRVQIKQKANIKSFKELKVCINVGGGRGGTAKGEVVIVF